jgi:N-acetylglucosamine kinase-like BadF-type ATPase
MRDYLLGVDGGNTKCIALVARRDGTIVGAGRAGCGDIYGCETPEGAVDEVELAASNALAAAGASPGDVVAATFSLAGADWPEDHDFLHTELSRRLAGAREIEVVNDALGALRAGTDDGVGVAVVCGTGGCVGARAPGGRVWHSSWWTPHTGGTTIGTLALEGVYRAELETGPPTSLTNAALTLFEAGTVEELLHAFTRRGGRPRVDASRFAPAVLREAAAGDAVARGIVVDQGRLLGELAAAAARIVGLAGQPYPLVLLGGVLRGGDADRLRAEVVSHVPEATPVAARFEPAAGALLLAFDAVGLRADERRLRETLPDAELFASANGSILAAPESSEEA